LWIHSKTVSSLNKLSSLFTKRLIAGLQLRVVFVPGHGIVRRESETSLKALYGQGNREVFNRSGFRQALEERLKARAHGDGARIARDRKRVAFDRFLARLALVASGSWLLKGGYALDLRLADLARSTKDIDVDWSESEDELLDTLIEAAAFDAADFFTFRVERTNAPPDHLGGARRFRVTAELAGRLFEAFILDIGYCDDPVGRTDTLTTPDFLAFAGIEPVKVSVIALTQQIAEKLHAYTRIYEGGKPSSRPKDLIDLVLIGGLFVIDAKQLQTDITKIFQKRASHPIPTRLPSPPATWNASFGQLAETIGIPSELDSAYMFVSRLLDPILSGQVTSRTWQPDTEKWI